MKKGLEIIENQGLQTSFVNYKFLLLIIASFVVGFVIQFFSTNIFNRGESELSIISVDRGDQIELNLSDGTKVVLNSGSELQFPKTFSNINSRNVTLKGEGYFEVQKSKKPFIVKTEYGDIVALGTKFNISAYASETFEATLIDGSIIYKTNKVEKVLNPGQQIRVEENKRIRLKNIKDTSFLEWKNGTISFSNEELGSVIKKLERHYDIDIKLDPDLAKIKFTGEIREESIEEVLTLVDITTPIKYNKNGKLKQIEIISRK